MVTLFIICVIFPAQWIFKVTKCQARFSYLGGFWNLSVSSKLSEDNELLKVKSRLGQHLGRPKFSINVFLPLLAALQVCKKAIGSLHRRRALAPRSPGMKARGACRAHDAAVRR